MLGVLRYLVVVAPNATLPPPLEHALRHFERSCLRSRIQIERLPDWDGQSLLPAEGAPADAAAIDAAAGTCSTADATCDASGAEPSPESTAGADDEGGDARVLHVPVSSGVHELVVEYALGARSRGCDEASDGSVAGVRTFVG